MTSPGRRASIRMSLAATRSTWPSATSPKLNGAQRTNDRTAYVPSVASISRLMGWKRTTAPHGRRVGRLMQPTAKCSASRTTVERARFDDPRILEGNKPQLAPFVLPTYEKGAKVQRRSGYGHE